MGLLSRRKKGILADAVGNKKEKIEVQEEIGSVVLDIKDDSDDERNELIRDILLPLSVTKMNQYVVSHEQPFQAEMTFRDGIDMPNSLIANQQVFGLVYHRGYVYWTLFRFSKERAEKLQHTYPNLCKSDWATYDDFYGIIWDCSSSPNDLFTLIDESYKYVTEEIHVDSEMDMKRAKNHVIGLTKELISRKGQVDAEYQKAIDQYKPRVEEINSLSYESLVVLKAELNEVEQASPKKEQSPEKVSVKKAEPKLDVKKAESIEKKEEMLAKDLTNDTEANVVKATFQNRVALSDDVVKDYYNQVRNALESYKKIHERMSATADSFRVGRKLVARIKFAGKNIKIFFALNPSSYENKKYHHMDLSEKKSFQDTPLMLKVKSRLSLENALFFIEELAKENELVVNEKYVATDFSHSYELAKGSVLEKKGYGSLVRKEIVAEEVKEVIRDDVALESVEYEKEEIKSKKNVKGLINIDTLSQNYFAGEVVSLDSLIAKNLVKKNVTYVKVLARGRLDKNLTVRLHDYSIDAIKMILLTGGKVIRIN